MSSHMSNHICTYCDATFTTRPSLLRHQSKATYCLKARGEISDKYTCDCGKSYSLQHNLTRHKKNCNRVPLSPIEKGNDMMVQVVEMIKELQKQNDELQKQVVEISTRPTKVVNNTVLNNLRPITDEGLQENLDNLKLDFILDGAKGYATFAKFYPLRNNIICTDRSRRKIKYKNENGEISDNARLLAQRFFQAISDRNKNILDTEYIGIHNKIKEIVLQNRAGESNITDLLTRATALQNILLCSQRAAEGEAEEFTQEFLNHLIK
jgi:hypothetical protein